jgi:hypothetical protein
MEWIKVAVGRGYAQDMVTIAWAPYAADVTQGSKTTHVEPVYEPTTPDCRNHAPTIGDLDAMLPLQALYCFGSGEIKLSPAIVRDEGSNDEGFAQGSPAWLAEDGNLVAYWLPEWSELGSIRLHIDPRAGTQIGEGTWVEITGHLDDPASTGCSRTSENEEFVLPDPEDAIAICRGRFVVSGVRRLTEAEIPPKPATQTPGPPPVMAADVVVREFEPPIQNRAGSAAVWTGSEMIVWGGFQSGRDSEPALDDGAAYAPAPQTWRAISKGPLQARSWSESAWTGSEMLIWGGQRNYRVELSDGAAFDPAANSWRMLPDAPIKWQLTNASVWTGTDWWIASERGGHVDVAVFDPAANSWRAVGGVDEDDFDSLSMAWTGSEIFMKTVRGLYRMAPDSKAWTFGPVDFSGPITWADGLVYGWRYDNVAPEPLGFESFIHPVAWDPSSSSERPMAAPPDDAYLPVWTGRYLAYFSNDLAYDPVEDTWLRLHTPRDPNVFGWDYVVENDGSAQVWADDRLIVWGGTNSCMGMMGSVPPSTGYEVIPTWPSSSAGADTVVTALALLGPAPGQTSSGGDSGVLAC